MMQRGCIVKRDRGSYFFLPLFLLKVKEANFDVDKTICQKCGIMGTPALLILENGELMGRFLGELNCGELETIIKNLLKIN